MIRNDSATGITIKCTYRSMFGPKLPLIAVGMIPLTPACLIQPANAAPKVAPKDFVQQLRSSGWAPMRRISDILS